MEISNPVPINLFWDLAFIPNVSKQASGSKGTTYWQRADFLGPEGIDWYALLAQDINRVDRSARVVSEDESEITGLQNLIDTNMTEFWTKVSTPT